jgi:hypothetical protein
MAQSPIFARTEVFMIWLFQHTAKFPKYERFRLAKKIDDALFEFHENLLCAVKLPDTKLSLEKADFALDRLRVYLRLSLEMKYTGDSQYRHAAEQLTEIGKLLGGWIKKASEDG